MQGVIYGYGGNRTIMDNENTLPFNTETSFSTTDEDKKIKLWQLREGIMAGNSFAYLRDIEVPLDTNPNYHKATECFLVYSDYSPEILPFNITSYIEVTLTNGKVYSTTLSLRVLGCTDASQSETSLVNRILYSNPSPLWYLGLDNNNQPCYLGYDFTISHAVTEGTGGGVISVPGAPSDIIAVGLTLNCRGFIPDTSSYFKIARLRVSSIGYGYGVEDLHTNTRSTQAEYDPPAVSFGVSYGSKSSTRYQPVYYTGGKLYPCFTIDTSGSLPAQPDSDTFYFVP